MDSAAFAHLLQAGQELRPEVGLVLGSGMSDVAGGLQSIASAAFAEIPGLGGASVSGHRGRLTLGRWASKAVLIFEGRLHYYEGRPWDAVVRPMHLARDLGVRKLLLTNAAGGIRSSLTPGSFLALRDHVEWTRPRSWLSPGPGALGPQRPSPYSASLRQTLIQAGQDLGLVIPEGIYASVTGPSYETPAEIRALQIWGADAVGMSTAREVQTAFDLGLECAGLSCITNQAAGLSGQPLSHEEVLTTARMQSQRLARLVERFVQLV
jgi:purine-nucleoside phosphorylase